MRGHISGSLRARRRFSMPRHSRSARLVWLLVLSAAIVLIGFLAQMNVVRAQDHGDRPGSAPKKGEPLNTKDISIDQARDIIHAAMQKADELKIKQNIAVVDAGGNLKGFARMDGAWVGSIDIAIKKAKTARMFDMPT